MDKALLATYLAYDPDEGVLRWKLDPNGVFKLGDRAGISVRGRGPSIRLFGLSFPAKMIAYLMAGRELKPGDIVYCLNGEDDDLRAANLGVIRADLEVAQPVWGGGGAETHPVIRFDRQRGRFIGNVVGKRWGKRIGEFRTKEEALQGCEDAMKLLRVRQSV